MKKVLLFSIAIAGVMSVSSCKKDYTCECTSTFAGTTTKSSVTIHDTKSKAESACSATAESDIAGYSVKCELK